MGYIRHLRRQLGTQPIIMVGVSIFVINEQNEILLQKRSDTGDWGVIGGALELGESLEQAARRELHEEAGLIAHDLRFVTVLSGSDMYYRYPHGDEIYNVANVYVTNIYEGEPRVLDDEGLELKFFPLDRPIANLNGMALQILSKSGYYRASGK